MKNKLIRKLQKLLDESLSQKDLVEDIRKDILDLKTNKEDNYYLSMENKYKDFE